MRCNPALALVAVFLCVVPQALASVPSTPFIAFVAANDARLGQSVISVEAPFGFLDGNSNSRADTTPDEPVYLDLDDSGSVTVDDLRITAFDAYPAGTFVVVTNHDVGRKLTLANGWFGHLQTDDWLADLDGSRTVSLGDINLGAEALGHRLGAEDARLGKPLSRPPTNSGLHAMAVLDADQNGRHSPGEALFLDLDADTPAGAGQLTVGDVHVITRGDGQDGAPTRAEFDALAEAAGVAADDGSFQPSGGISQGVAAGLYVLGAANLLGLAFVYMTMRRRGPPKNPFK